MPPPEPPGEETEEPPERDRFRVELGEPIREGRGEVLHAVDELLGRRVVLKRTDPGEARAYAKFNHPHVVTVHELLTIEAGPRAGTWLVMEHVAGGSLQDRRMSWREAAEAGAQIADALAALHAKGLVHCDVKPANIVVAADGAAKLTDFDAAHRVGGDETITPSRPISYTPDYAAPEVVGGTPRPASDVFSLAATLHALVTGHPPRPWARGEQEHEARDLDDERIQRWGARRGIVELDPNAGLGPLRPLLAEMLALDPADRPDAARARTLLRAAASRSRFRPRPPWRVLGVAAGVVVLGAAAAIAWLGGDSGDSRNSKDSGDSGDSGPSATPPAGSGASSVIGDARTVDPCALFDVVMLGHEFGMEADLDGAYGNFDRCDVILDPGGETPVDIEINFDFGAEGQGQQPIRSVGDIGILDLGEETDSCGRGLRLPKEDEDIGIAVVASYESDDEGDMPLCRIADETADSGAATLMDARDRGQRIDRRTLPDNSLAHLDACALLDGQALADVVPVDVGEPTDIGFGNWKCEWENGSGDLEASVSFDQGNELDGDDGRPTRIGGRDAFVTEGFDSDDSCTVRVEHRAFTGPGGTEKTELLHVYAAGDRPTERLCAMATDLATAVTERLPPP